MLSGKEEEIFLLLNPIYAYFGTDLIAAVKSFFISQGTLAQYG